MPKLKQGTLVPTPEEDAEIAAAAIDDQDSASYTDEEWAKVTPTLGPGPLSEEASKVPISIRLDVRVLDAFRATGDGWQTRINDALLQYAKLHGMIEHG